MNCEETGLQKSISDSAEMRQVFCKTNSHFIQSHFFTPFYLLCFHSSCLSSGFTDTLLTTTLPFHQLLSALGPSPLLLSLWLHFSDALLLLLLLPFATPILSALYLAFWLLFSCHDPVPSGALSSLFCFLLPLLCPIHLFHAPAGYLQSAAQLQFLLRQLLPNPSPPGSFFSLLLYFIVLFFFSDIVPTSHIPSLWSQVLLLHGCPFPLSLRWFPRSPLVLPECLFPSCLCLSVCLSSSLFVLGFFLPWLPPLPRGGGFILMQSCKVSRATSISLI